MIKIKIIKGNTTEIVERDINEFLLNLHRNREHTYQLIDIKSISSNEGLHEYVMMILYSLT